ncbi:MAG: M48 family metallopeptidase [Alphaproteobacteria bacterium]|nr:M48 family metallopeptidase [Alphaproteobacteria bacterium]
MVDRYGTRLWGPALLALGLYACTPTTLAPEVTSAEEEQEIREQQKLVIDRRIQDGARVRQAGFPLLRDAVDYCGDKTAPRHGFLARTAADFDKDERALATELYGLGELPKVLSVAKGAPADQAGLLVGDVIVAIDGRRLSSASAGSAYTPPNTRERMDELIDKAAYQPLTFRVEREDSIDGSAIQIVSTPAKVCDYEFSVKVDDSVNAFADGKRIILTTGMLRFIETESELDAVLAHELAHNAMGHVDARMTNAAIGSGVGLAFDILAAVAGVNTQGGFSKIGANIGGGAFSQSFEAEADYVGLYIMAQADKDYQDAPRLWRRMATANPDSIVHASTHPTTAERFVALKKAIAEIDRKKEAGEPLKPEVETVEAAAPGETESFVDR